MQLSCLLDRKGLVCDFAGAVVNKSQLQTAERWRANFIFDPSDLHILLVLGNKPTFSISFGDPILMESQTFYHFHLP